MRTLFRSMEQQTNRTTTTATTNWTPAKTATATTGFSKNTRAGAARAPPPIPATSAAKNASPNETSLPANALMIKTGITK